MGVRGLRMAKGGPGFARGVRSPNPIAELDDFISAGRWFEGIVLAGVFLEAWGQENATHLL